MSVKLMKIGELRRQKLGGASHGFVYEAIKRKELPQPIKMGRSSYWDEAEVDECIEKLRQKRDLESLRKNKRRIG